MKKINYFPFRSRISKKAHSVLLVLRQRLEKSGQQCYLQGFVTVSDSSWFRGEGISYLLLLSITSFH